MKWMHLFDRAIITMISVLFVGMWTKVLPSPVGAIVATICAIILVRLDLLIALQDIVAREPLPAAWQDEESHRWLDDPDGSEQEASE